MPSTEDLDAISIETLRSIGGEKWSTYPEAIGAFVAEMDFGLAYPIRSSLLSAVQAGHVGYLPLPLSRESSEAAASFLTENFGWQVSPDWVRPVADVMECYAHAIEHFSEPGSPIIIPTPAYTPFHKVARLRSRRIIEVPMVRQGNHWGLDNEGIKAALNGQPGLVVLCNPHNPTGAVATLEELQSLSAVVEHAGARVFSDEIHSALTYSGQRHIPYASISTVAAGHSVTAISASKAWNLAGLKCAHMVLSNELDVATWQEKLPRAELSTSTLGAVATVAAYRGGAAWLEDIRNYLALNRDLVISELKQYLPTAHCHVPESTYFAWIDCSPLGLPGNAREFFLDHAGVALTDGSTFGATGANHVRLNFATPRPILQQAIHRMGEAVSQLGRPQESLIRHT